MGWGLGLTGDKVSRKAWVLQAFSEPERKLACEALENLLASRRAAFASVKAHGFRESDYNIKTLETLLHDFKEEAPRRLEDF